MRLPRTTRRLMVIVAIVTPAFAVPSGLARPGDATQPPAVTAASDKPGQPTVSSIVQQAVLAASDGPAKDSVLETAAVVLARAGHADDVLRLADGDRDPRLKESIIRATAIGQARSRDFAGALRTAHLLPAPESRRIAGFIAAEQAWDGDLPAARHMVETELTGQPESVLAIRLIGLVLEQKGEFGAAARMYAANPSLKEKARSCRPAALAQLKEGNIPAALKAAEFSRRLAIAYLAQKPPATTQGSGTPPDIGPESFRDCILAEIALEQAKRGDASGARKTTEAISYEYLRALTAAKAAAITARRGDRASARALIKWSFDLAELAGYRGYELMEIASAETLAGETEAARKTFLRALATVGPSAMNQSIVVDAQAKAGDLEGALQTIEAINDSGAKERALRYIVRTLAKTGDSRRAVEIAGRLSANERVLALHDASEAQAERGDRVGALATVHLATAIDWPLEGETLRALARSLCQLSDAREALVWVNRRSTPATRAWGLLGVAEGLLPRGVDATLQLDGE
jgi:tetratricopeptide (TPR) repeat protein